MIWLSNVLPDIHVDEKPVCNYLNLKPSPVLHISKAFLCHIQIWSKRDNALCFVKTLTRPFHSFRKPHWSFSWSWCTQPFLWRPSLTPLTPALSVPRAAPAFIVLLLTQSPFTDVHSKQRSIDVTEFYLLLNLRLLIRTEYTLWLGSLWTQLQL